MAVVVELWCVAALLALAVLAVPLSRAHAGSPIVYGGALVLSLIGLGNAVAALAAPAGTLALPLGLPGTGAHFRLDGLSAVFLAIVHLCGASASLYAIGYGRHADAPGRVLPFFPAFLAAMSLVLLADDAYSFLFAWESMSLASWALVIADHRAAENRRAAYVYLVMASFGTFLLMLAFGLLAGTAGIYDFVGLRAHPPAALVGGVVLGLALLGAGSKAGLVPLHAWLPLAHPAAPSHVSALMSAGMTKVAVYGFLRIVFDLMGPPQWWWGIPVLAAGAASAALGVLYALMQSDIKRALAYSTIENIGIVFVGLGLALAFTANALPAAGALALTAALFHALNHALFKSLLFFGAGAVLGATGVRDMERMGGLIHGMPVTAFAMLIACAAISALPPLNGFVSEWLIFQAILISPELPAWGLKLLVPAAGALLALAAALAAACFVRLYGISFLGRPRGPQAAAAREVDRWQLGAMLALAGLCVLAGVLPGLVIDAMAPAVAALTGARMPPQAGVAWLSIIPVAESRSSYNGLLVLVFVAGSAALVAAAIHRFASRAVRRAPAWDCGFPNAGLRTQYTASSFAQPIRRVFGATVFSAREQIHMPPPGDLSPARFRLRLVDPAWDGLYLPLARAVWALSGRMNALQYLSIRRYLALVFGALVLLLLVLALWG
ncbi:hydrogenase 4 subunit B [Azorhizobium doebereinerae]|uniref:hydrogenase 4 subunit B n=1 Tax=Azorhizobium doebereinerae TaxID=281091 RepID=UPI00048E175C|nr:hydrogenase 4 subunit B [Azorhizobium doebereinerae]